MIDCNEWRTEKRHEHANMGKVKRLELWWQLYRTSLPVWDLENFRPMDFCWHECTRAWVVTQTTAAFTPMHRQDKSIDALCRLWPKVNPLPAIVYIVCYLCTQENSLFSSRASKMHMTMEIQQFATWPTACFDVYM